MIVAAVAAMGAGVVSVELLATTFASDANYKLLLLQDPPVNEYCVR